ncbi:MAG: RNA polymerase sigma factor [Oscillospiraceae bacterium]|nr:RNA polymerase sigma factor [Oscillospiraceae bacterium]
MNLESIYQQHVDTVYRVCYSYLKSQADAEDAAQDTFVKLMKSAKATIISSSETHLKAWLIRTAANTCIDRLRRHRAEPLDNYEQLPGNDDASNEVLQAVLDLPDKYKSVVYLFYYEGYASEEIARALRKPSSTVRNHLHEARKLLKERLGDLYEAQ